MRTPPKEIHLSIVHPLSRPELTGNVEPFLTDPVRLYAQPRRLQGYLAHKKQAPLGPYCRTMPRALRRS